MWLNVVSDCNAGHSNRDPLYSAGERSKTTGMKPVSEIVSGGQTGVDRAALDMALALGIHCSGWCPQGRRAEDGVIPDCYPLRETSGKNYHIRTEWNVRDSDATLILNLGPLEGGTARTVEAARQLQRPCLVIGLEYEPDPITVCEWLRRHRIRKLNIAGPRESKWPGIHDRAALFLRRVFAS